MHDKRQSADAYERASFDFEIKADEESRTIEGWASVFNNEDKGRDIVLPGAFLKSLSRRKASDKVPMLWQHDIREPIGVWHELREIDKGLYGKGEIVDTARGMDAYKLLKAGAIKGLSIGYSTKQYEIDQKKGVRKLIELDLGEVSLVTAPMNEQAVVTRVKSQPATLREFEDFLREAGFSRDDATTVALRGFKALNPGREAEADEQPELDELKKLFGDFTKQLSL